MRKVEGTLSFPSQAPCGDVSQSGTPQHEGPLNIPIRVLSKCYTKQSGRPEGHRRTSVAGSCALRFLRPPGDGGHLSTGVGTQLQPLRGRQPPCSRQGLGSGPKKPKRSVVRGTFGVLKNGPLPGLALLVSLQTSPKRGPSKKTRFLARFCL